MFGFGGGVWRFLNFSLQHSFLCLLFLQTILLLLYLPPSIYLKGKGDKKEGRLAFGAGSSRHTPLSPAGPALALPRLPCCLPREEEASVSLGEVSSPLPCLASGTSLWKVEKAGRDRQEGRPSSLHTHTPSPASTAYELPSSKM